MPQTGETADARRDLDEMEAMLDEYLDFARGDGSEETQRIDLVGLTRDVVEDARRHGGDIRFDTEGELDAELRPGAIRRALANLIGNATSFGEVVEVTVEPNGARIEIRVEDDGPGIPEDQYDEALKPFNRLDESRNQNRKGVGLGLALARDVARGHGGDIKLGRSELGGLLAVISLPQ
ncbi:MAG: two-component system osmolarity sensor histidine kinase EnvZ [Maricaulis maris]|jgi:two-component system osmolarity sensor histidine kinase EnvZ